MTTHDWLRAGKVEVQLRNWQVEVRVQVFTRRLSGTITAIDDHGFVIEVAEEGAFYLPLEEVAYIRRRKEPAA